LGIVIFDSLSQAREERWDTPAVILPIFAKFSRQGLFLAVGTEKDEGREHSISQRRPGMVQQQAPQGGGNQAEVHRMAHDGERAAGHQFASGFLQTSSHDNALAFR